MARCSPRTTCTAGTAGALQTDFPTSVNNVWAKPPKAAMVIEADFVPGVATTKAKAITDYNVFKFPSIGGSRRPSSVPATSSSCSRTALPARRSSSTWRRRLRRRSRRSTRRAYSSPNKNVPASAYTDALNRVTAIQLAAREDVPVRPLRPRPVGVRRHGRAGRVQAVPGLPQDPVRRERHRGPDGGGGKEGLQVSRG